MKMKACYAKRIIVVVMKKKIKSKIAEIWGE